MFNIADDSLYLQFFAVVYLPSTLLYFDIPKVYTNDISHGS